MKRLKIGLVGLGRVATSTHIPVLKCCEDVDIVACAEKDRDRAQRVQGLFRLPIVYADYNEMYQAQALDAVLVLLPHHLHKDACEKALEAGFAVLCEKPMGTSVAEAEDITRVAEKKGLVLMPGYKRRYASNFAKAHELIEGGLLGKIIHVQGVFVTPGPYISWDPKSDWYLDRRWHGVVYDVACHLLDILFYLVPHDVVGTSFLDNRGFIGYDVPTNISCAFEMTGGILGDLSIGWRGSTDVFLISIHGTAGSLTVGTDYFSYVHPGTDPLDKLGALVSNIYSGCISILGKVKDKVTGRNFYGEDLLQARAFLDAVKGLREQPVNGRDAIRIHSFLERLIH